MAERLAVVKVETVRCTLSKVRWQALVNKLSATIADVKFKTFIHKVV